ncbi:MAG: methionyl-tRNA formyltransferase, partial [Candidatus Absconditabacterales bacterium]
LKRYGFRPGIFYAFDRVLHCTGGMGKIYDPDHYKVVFFSSAPIGVPFLQSLSEDKRFEVIGVVTQPDKPSGRGMEMNECIIKKETKRLFSSSSNISKIILIHGKDATPQDKRYPRFAQQMKDMGIPTFIPTLPDTNEPKLTERLKEIDKLKPDENTILIGHSRGGVAIMRRLENNAKKKKVKKVILIATNDGHSKYMPNTEKNQGFYNTHGYDFTKIKSTCDDFVVFHSKDDERVDYRAGEENAKGLHAHFRSFTDKKHFGKNLTETGFPELMDEIKNVSTLPPFHLSTFIQTPSKLNPSKSTEGRQFSERLTKKNPDFLVVIAYGKIIPQAILDIPQIAPINIHGSLLPKYRGASPIQTCLLNDDKETGITIMKMDAGLDTGAMIDKRGFHIALDRTAKDIIAKMQDFGPAFLNDTLRKYGKKMLGEVKQNESLATFCSKIEKESGLIDPRKDSLHDVYRKYRAFYQRPKIYFILKEKRIIIEELKIKKELHNISTFQYFNISTERKTPLINDGNNLNQIIESLSLKPEGKKPMSWKEFANGYLK